MIENSSTGEQVEILSETTELLLDARLLDPSRPPCRPTPAPVPSVVHVVPLTTTIRTFHSEIVIAPDETNGLGDVYAAQCQHIRAVSPRRILGVRGNVGATVLAQLRETIAVILDLP